MGAGRLSAGSGVEPEPMRRAMRIDAPDICERLLVKAPFRFRRETAPLPALGDADYVVRVDVCGLCRSDLHAAASWAEQWQEVGHEFGGTVVATRGAGARFRTGDRVAVRNASPCGECPRCREGAARGCTHLVVNMQGFRDYAVCDERSLVDAAGLDDTALALVEPVNVALDLLHTAQLDAGQSVVVLGAGTLGLLTAYLARQIFSASRVVVVGRQPSSSTAGALGLTYAPALPEGVPSAAGGSRVPRADRVLVTTPPSTIEQALALCRPGGRILTVGLDETERCRITFDISRLIFGQFTLQGVCAAPNVHFEQAISVLRQHGASLGVLIGRRVPRSGLEAALGAWHTRGRFDGKTIVVRDGHLQ